MRCEKLFYSFKSPADSNIAGSSTCRKLLCTIRGVIPTTRFWRSSNAAIAFLNQKIWSLSYFKYIRQVLACLQNIYRTKSGMELLLWMIHTDEFVGATVEWKPDPSSHRRRIDGRINSESPLKETSITGQPSLNIISRPCEVWRHSIHSQKLYTLHRLTSDQHIQIQAAILILIWKVRQFTHEFLVSGISDGKWA